MNRLRELRKKKKYTQIKVQMLTGIDQSDYSKLESGKRYPTVEQAKRLSQIFDTSIDYIVGATDEPQAYPKAYKKNDD
ncbi:transcriptional regulator with XRE-family HTH domain [Clostridiales Family XIII bacterium PM5-7]